MMNDIKGAGHNNNKPVIALLHLSDYHISPATDSVESLARTAKELAGCCFEEARAADYTVIAFTGDIAFDGKTESFELALSFISALVAELAQETNRPVYVVTAPGNHDGVLSPEDMARKDFIENTLRTTEHPNYKKAVAQCVGVQQNYFSFVAKLPNQPRKVTPDQASDDLLLMEYLVGPEESPVRLFCFNIAWSSLLNEKQGTLMFPVSAYEHRLTAPAELRIALLHHPFSWYRPDSTHAFESALHRHVSVLMTGHEHNETSVDSDIHSVGRLLQLKGGAIRPEGGGIPSFVLWTTDLQNLTLRKQAFSYVSGGWSAADALAINIPKEVAQKGIQAKLTEHATDWLSTQALRLANSEGGVVPLTATFVRPDLFRTGKSKKFENSTFFKRPTGSFSIRGGAGAGKTSLLKQLFHSYHSAGYLPLYVDANLFSGCSTEAELNAVIAGQVNVLYVHPAEVYRAGRDSRVMLLDNLECVPVSIVGPLYELIDRANKYLVVTSGSILDLQESLDRCHAKWAALEHLSIAPFKGPQREHLIQKWASAQNLIDTEQAATYVHNTAEKLNVLMRGNAFSPTPFNSVMLINALTSGAEVGQHLGFDACYEALITTSLKSASNSVAGTLGVRQVFSYLTHLAWKFYTENKTSISESELLSWTDTYREHDDLIHVKQIIQWVTASKLLRVIRCSSGGMDYYDFYEPYLYYYFVTRYVSNNLDDFEQGTAAITPSQREVLKWCADLSMPDHGMLLSFYAYQNNKAWLLNQLKEMLERSFDFIDLSAHNAYEKGLSSLSAELSTELKAELYSNMDVAAPDLSRFTIETSKMLAATTVTSHMLKAYYVDIKLDARQVLVGSLLRAHIRWLTAYFELVKEHKQVYLTEVTNQVSASLANESTRKVQEAVSRKAIEKLTQVYLLVTGLAAVAIGHPGLDRSAKACVERETVPGFELLRLCSFFTRPSRLPLDEVEQFLSRVGSDPLPYQVFEVFASLYHLTVPDSFVTHTYRPLSKDTDRLKSLIAKNPIKRKLR